tara:strand:+ start:62 stop:1003 length:942 start_codon:yes stop_codon:yes gene_type:complete
MRCHSTSFGTGDKQQHTLAGEACFEGVTLHKGCAGKMLIKPALPSHGIVFKRTDVKAPENLVRASWDNVSDTALCTTVSNQSGLKVSTIEHLMAAFSGCGIDNALVEINCAEVPIMDGSARPFVDMFEEIGLRQQQASRRFIKILKPIEIQEKDAWIELSPAKNFSIDFEIDFNSEAIKDTSFNISLVNGAFNHEISSARTFGFLEDVDRMRSAGLGLGGSLKNVVVVDGSKVLNNDGLRFKDEFVRHKILDCVGDLYLCGGPIIGCVKAYKTGHYFNNKLLRKLFSEKSSWTWASQESDHTLFEDQPQMAIA